MGEKVNAGPPPQSATFARVAAGARGKSAELMQRTQGASSSGKCKLKRGLRPPGTWRWAPLRGLGALGNNGTRRGQQVMCHAQSLSLR